MTDELRDLDMQWAELSGWKRSGAWFYDTDGGHHLRPSSATGCWAVGSPWQWLRANAVSVELRVQGHTVMPRCVAILPSDRGFRPVVSCDGATETEAILRTAIAAKKELGVKA